MSALVELMSPGLVSYAVLPVALFFVGGITGSAISHNGVRLARAGDLVRQRRRGVRLAGVVASVLGGLGFTVWVASLAAMAAAAITDALAGRGLGLVPPAVTALVLALVVVTPLALSLLVVIPFVALTWRLVFHGVVVALAAYPPGRQLIEAVAVVGAGAALVSMFGPGFLFSVAAAVALFGAGVAYRVNGVYVNATFTDGPVIFPTSVTVLADGSVQVWAIGDRVRVTIDGSTPSTTGMRGRISHFNMAGIDRVGLIAVDVDGVGARCFLPRHLTWLGRTLPGVLHTGGDR